MLTWLKSDFKVLPIAIIIIIGISIIFKYLVSNNKISRRLPFLFITIFLLVFEVVKIIYYAINGNFFGGLPFHISSFFMLFYSLHVFGENKFKEVGTALSFLMSIGFSIVFFIQPSIIIGDATANLLTSFYAFHTFTYHILMVLYGILMLVLGEYKPSMKNNLSIIIVLFALMSNSFVFALLSKENYASLLDNPIFVLENIRTISNDFVFFLSYSTLLASAIVVFNVLCVFVYKLITISSLKRVKQEI